jgi:hypothetical protein
MADTGPRAHAQLAGFDRSFHRTGLITLPNASRPIMIRKKTKDTKRKNATRIDSTLIRCAGSSPKMTVWGTRNLRLGMKDR